MPVLPNPRHERYAQLIVAGLANGEPNLARQDGVSVGVVPRLLLSQGRGSASRYFVSLNGNRQRAQACCCPVRFSDLPDLRKVKR
jgi:hypothetical protein